MAAQHSHGGVFLSGAQSRGNPIYRDWMVEEMMERPRKADAPPGSAF